MITQVRTVLHTQGGQRITYDFAYPLYGALLHRLPETLATFLHGNAIRPINHYLLLDRQTPDRAVQICNILNDAAAEAVLPVLTGTQTYELPKYGCRLRTEPPEVSRIDPQAFAHAFFTMPQSARRVTLHLHSPTTFRTDGRYALYPSQELILKSAVEKFAALGAGMEVDDLEAIAQLIAHTEITDYNLRSFRYRLKEVRIPAFLGRVSLSIRGPEPMVRLFDMLMASLSYTGLGIKTSLGMGGVDAEAIARTGSTQLPAEGFAPRILTGFESGIQ